VGPDWDTCAVSGSSFGDALGDLVRRDRWDFYSREVGDAKGPGVEELHDHHEIATLLTAAAPHSRVWPEDPEIVAWYGVRDDVGLASIAALVKWESGYHVVSSVATRADARGRGLSTRVMTGVVVAAARRRIPWLGLGVAHDNYVAQGVYERTGFTRRAEFSVYRSPDDHARGHG
jgi:ribosomal protein S18 acetylase RimI-like enzyme